MLNVTQKLMGSITIITARSGGYIKVIPTDIQLDCCYVPEEAQSEVKPMP